MARINNYRGKETKQYLVLRWLKREAFHYCIFAFTAYVTACVTIGVVWVIVLGLVFLIKAFHTAVSFRATNTVQYVSAPNDPNVTAQNLTYDMHAYDHLTLSNPLKDFSAG